MTDDGGEGQKAGIIGNFQDAVGAADGDGHRDGDGLHGVARILRAVEGSGDGEGFGFAQLHGGGLGFRCSGDFGGRLAHQTAHGPDAGVKGTCVVDPAVAHVDRQQLTAVIELIVIAPVEVARIAVIVGTVVKGRGDGMLQVNLEAPLGTVVVVIGAIHVHKALFIDPAPCVDHVEVIHILSVGAVVEGLAVGDGHELGILAPVEGSDVLAGIGVHQQHIGAVDRDEQALFRQIGCPGQIEVADAGAADLLRFQGHGVHPVEPGAHVLVQVGGVDGAVGQTGGGDEGLGDGSALLPPGQGVGVEGGPPDFGIFIPDDGLQLLIQTLDGDGAAGTGGGIDDGGGGDDGGALGVGGDRAPLVHRGNIGIGGGPGDGVVGDGPGADDRVQRHAVADHGLGRGGKLDGGDILGGLEYIAGGLGTDVKACGVVRQGADDGDFRRGGIHIQQVVDIVLEDDPA